MLRPVKRDVPAPMRMSARPLSARLANTACRPLCTAKGATGKIAPTANKAKDVNGAVQFLGIESQLLAHERVERGVLVGDETIGERARLAFLEALGPIDEHQLFLLFLGHARELIGLDV